MNPITPENFLNRVAEVSTGVKTMNCEDLEGEVQHFGNIYDFRKYYKENWTKAKQEADYSVKEIEEYEGKSQSEYD